MIIIKSATSETFKWIKGYLPQNSQFLACITKLKAILIDAWSSTHFIRRQVLVLASCSKALKMMDSTADQKQVPVTISSWFNKSDLFLCNSLFQNCTRVEYRFVGGIPHRQSGLICCYIYAYTDSDTWQVWVQILGLETAVYGHYGS